MPVEEHAPLHGRGSRDGRHTRRSPGRRQALLPTAARRARRRLHALARQHDGPAGVPRSVRPGRSSGTGTSPDIPTSRARDVEARCLVSASGDADSHHHPEVPNEIEGERAHGGEADDLHAELVEASW